MEEELYNSILEKVIEEMSLSGAVGGVSLPLGATPESINNKKKKRYKKSTATDKKHRSKKRKSMSVQQCLQKEGTYIFKDFVNLIRGNKLNEARTSRVQDLKKSEIISFLKYLKGEVDQNINFSATEKIAGQAMTIGIRGTSRGNAVYAATKDSLIQMGNNIFHQRFFKSGGSSREIKNVFIKRFRKLSIGEEIKLGMEIIKSDKSKPDYIAYNVPRNKIYVAVFSITPDDPTLKEEIKTFSGNYFNRRKRRNTEITFLLPEDIPMSPEINVSDSIKQEIDQIIVEVEEAPVRKALGSDHPVKKYVKDNIAPKIMSLVQSIFPRSNINPKSPVEGVAINMSSGEENTFFKVPNLTFDQLQSVQASIHAEFKSNKYKSNAQRSQEFMNFITNKPKGQNFARNVFKLVKFLHEKNTLPKNFRTFFSPENLDMFCAEMLEGLKENNIHKVSSAIMMLTGYLYTCKGNENFTSPLTKKLIDYLEKNNLI